MATQDIKNFLFQHTGIAASQWKRLSKHKDSDGYEVRVFEDKSSGQIIETLEDKNGTISIVDKSNAEQANPSTEKTSVRASSDDKKALSLIKKYYKTQDFDDDESKVGFAKIPMYFKFSFLEDSNTDHQVALEEARKNSNRQVAVTGFNLFFSPMFKAPDEVIHLGPLLEPFLPYFLTETEEATFSVYAEAAHIYDKERLDALRDGTIPIVQYDNLVATLEQAGFTYDSANCVLASLGGSQGAKPFEESKENISKPKFCMILVKNPMYEEETFYYPEFLTALIVETPKELTRDAKKKLINKTLKTFGCFNPGRLMNNMLPQIELFQIAKKSTSSMGIEGKDREKVFNLLTQSGWEEDQSLASEENAKKWTLEQWAVTPMTADPFVRISRSPRISDHASEIEYVIWKRPKPNLKP